MKMPLLALAGAAILFCGCDRKVIVEKDHHRSSEAANDSAAPAAAPVAAQTADVPQGEAPQYYEEGTTYEGNPITEPSGIDDYVDVNGGWYYWHPTLNIWVHAHHPADWHPPQNVHVYKNWNEHPMFHRENGRR